MPTTIKCSAKQRILDRDMYGVAIGDQVVHVSDPSWTGTVTKLDRNLPDVATCRVHWDDEPAGVTDIVWTNKLRVREDV
jgi:hypothetical protein